MALALAAAQPVVEASLGYPFSDVRVSLSAGPARLGLMAGEAGLVALRAGVVGRIEAKGAVAPGFEVVVARSFGVTHRVTSTWDLSLIGELGVELDRRTTLTLRLGGLGYLGAESSQRGAVASLGLRVWIGVTESARFYVELGGLFGRQSSVPSGGFGVELR